MTADDWSHDEAEIAREETADAAGMSPQMMDSRRALPRPHSSQPNWPSIEGVDFVPVEGNDEY